MKLFTYGDLETRLRQSMDLLDVDNFIVGDEMVNYFNEAIIDAESEIMLLNQDYFLKEATITMVQGQSEYAVPTDIYGQKIRGLLYSNGPRIYPILRVKELNQFYKYEEINFYSTGETEYGYMLRNDNNGGQPTISLTPAAKENGGFIKLWYIRHANRVPIIGEGGASRASQLSTVIDIPEWVDYLVQFAKVRCYEKEMDSRLPSAISMLQNRKQMMVESLGKQVIDNSDEVPMDTQFYSECN